MVRFLAFWGPYIAGGLAVISLAGLVRLIWKSPHKLPRGWKQWIGGIVLLLLVGVFTLLTAGLNYFSSSTKMLDRRIDSTLNQPAPPLQFRLLSHESPNQLADFRGQVIILNFWAIWCQPCRPELQVLEHRANQH